MMDEERFLPPPVAPSDEEPIAPGGWRKGVKTLNEMKSFLPPPVARSDEEPTAAGGW